MEIKDLYHSVKRSLCTCLYTGGTICGAFALFLAAVGAVAALLFAPPWVATDQWVTWTSTVGGVAVALLGLGTLLVWGGFRADPTV